jgi:hypothetical protein
MAWKAEWKLPAVFVERHGNPAAVGRQSDEQESAEVAKKGKKRGTFYFYGRMGH